MKMKNFILKGHSTVYCLILTLIILAGFGSCKDDVINNSAVPYDPSQPVVISDFTPKTGGVGQQLVIYGKNFGDNPDSIHVYIGGIEAVVIGVKDENIYCLVPSGAYDGNIDIYMGDNPDLIASASEAFGYERKTVVSTLVGYKDERDDQGWIDGKFDVAAGFRNPSFMTFDPENSKHLYISYDFGAGIYLVNFEDSTVTQHLSASAGNWDRLRSIDFTLDGQYMIVAQDQGSVNGVSTSILSRAKDFKDPQTLTLSKQCNGAAIHPLTGEMYFNSYEKGQVYRYDVMNSKTIVGNSGIDSQDYNLLYLVQDNGWEFHFHMHPSGNYAYIMVVNQHYILRTDYDWTTKSFSQPYVVCGESRVGGYLDGVGSKARLRNPYQGVFVKNPDYAGQDDEYDFYFTEQYNHDIRILTPQGKVTTFAGRGSTSLDSNAWGYVDGDLRVKARFDQPTGIAYDSVEKAFYVGDMQNRCIRKIALEQ